MLHKRNNSLDIAKGLCILLVIWGHTVCPVKPFYYPFHIPMFFLLSGFVFNESNSLKATFFKKIKSLLIPFFFFLILLRVGFIIIHLIDHSFSMELFLPWKPMYPGITLGPLWFILTLFTTTMFVSLLYSIVKQENMRFFICLFLTFLGYLLFKYRVHLPLHIDSSLSMMFFFYVGWFLNIKKISNLKRSVAFFGSLGFILVYILYSTIHLPEIDISLNYFEGPFLPSIGIMILGCITIFTMSIFLDKIPVIRSILGYIGRNSLTVFAIHLVFIYCAYLLFPKSSVSTIGGLLIVGYALIMSLLMNFLLKKYAPFVFGNFERQK